MKGIILAGGHGSKLWPYTSHRNKTMVKIGNKPIVSHLVSSLKAAGVKEIMVVGVDFMQDIKHEFRKDNDVVVKTLSQSRGSGDTLYQVRDDIVGDCVVVYGDCLIMEDDMKGFLKSQNNIFVAQLHQDSTQQVCLDMDEDHRAKAFWGHPRGDFHYFAAGFKVSSKLIASLENTQDFFNETKVGVGSPQEVYLENALNDWINEGHVMTCYESQWPVYDIDKPWQIMEANHFYNDYRATQISGQDIGEHTYISDSAKIAEHVVIGEHCYIGDYVEIESGCVIGHHTRIDRGAKVEKNVHIGHDCVIENFCKVGSHSSLGNQCIVGQTAEIIEAVFFDKVYMYHYGEYYGVIGTHTDLGAGTTCGTLRFDDGRSQHIQCGHREIPKHYSQACYIGDYSRTGVGAILLPGCKVGSKSVVSSGVILNEDVEDETLIYPKQELCKVPWGDKKYGW